MNPDHRTMTRKMGKGVYYKVTVTKNKLSAIEYWYYISYKVMMDDVERLYSSGVDAIELEEITRKEYEKNNN